MDPVTHLLVGCGLPRIAGVSPGACTGTGVPGREGWSPVLPRGRAQGSWAGRGAGSQRSTPALSRNCPLPPAAPFTSPFPLGTLSHHRSNTVPRWVPSGGTMCLLLPTRSHCFGDPSWSGVTCLLPPSPLPSAGKACEAGSCSQEPSTGTLESCADSVPLCPRRQPRPSRAEARGATACPRECCRGRKNHTTEPSLRGRTGSRVESCLESLSVVGVACEAALMWQ